ncbi:hypothetical protein FACS1894202_13150 [Clostridia bacterium]|nr:hypothetical protein FACS1894202_13150 [Clostridia bacterium]
MDKPTREIMYIAVLTIITAVILTVSLPFAFAAHKSESDRISEKSELVTLIDNREWSKYTGVQTGADMINFIIRHKDSCEVIVRNADGSVINFTNAPDYYFDTAYLFDKVLNGRGERTYSAIRIDSGIEYREVGV